VHHVAWIYPIEIQLAQVLATGKPVTDVTWEAVAEINAAHAKEHEGGTKQAALELLGKNSAPAAAKTRALSDTKLARTSTRGRHGTRGWSRQRRCSATSRPGGRASTPWRIARSGTAIPTARRFERRWGASASAHRNGRTTNGESPNRAGFHRDRCTRRSRVVGF